MDKSSGEWPTYYFLFIVISAFALVAILIMAFSMLGHHSADQQAANMVPPMEVHAGAGPYKVQGPPPPPKPPTALLDVPPSAKAGGSTAPPQQQTPAPPSGY